MRLSLWIVPMILAAAPSFAQSDEAELKRISEMARQCREQSNKFREAGGRAGEAGDPALQWARTFWQYAKEHPRTPAGSQATVNALGWLMHADQDREVIAKAELLPLDFPLWGSVIEKLRLSSTAAGNYTTFRNITGRLLDQSKDKRLRAAVHLGVGRFYQDQGEPDKARAAFQAALR